ncbi:MAG: asparaginase [bacterium]|nr:asparaginase [bacterium]
MTTDVFILYTGGTIGMGPREPEDPSSPLEPKSIGELFRFLPDFSLYGEKRGGRYRNDGPNPRAVEAGRGGLPFLELDNGNTIRFGSASFERPVDSSDVGPSDWRRMAETIASVYGDYDGFVILHGTDTMAYTASALSFMLQNLGKPVVITGSQLPVSAVRTDAVLNLMNAVFIAGYQAADLPLVPEVVIVFADRIVRGCRASKVSTSDWAGIDSPNAPLLGTIGERIKIRQEAVRPVPERPFALNPALDENVFIIDLFPGFRSDRIEGLFRNPDIRGYILRTYGTGNIPNDGALLGLIRDAIEAGKIVMNLSQCGTGMVEMGLYAASSELIDLGILSGLDMTREAAVTKMMWILGSGAGRPEQELQIDHRGEQSGSLFHLFFGRLPKEDAAAACRRSLIPDARLNRARISRSSLRISNLGLEGAAPGERSTLHAYLNLPETDHRTPADGEKRIATLEFEWNGRPETRIKVVTRKTQAAIGEGEVALTLVSGRPEHRFHFSGLHLEILATA